MMGLLTLEGRVVMLFSRDRETFEGRKEFVEIVIAKEVGDNHTFYVDAPYDELWRHTLGKTVRVDKDEAIRGGCAYARVDLEVPGVLGSRTYRGSYYREQAPLSIMRNTTAA